MIPVLYLSLLFLWEPKDKTIKVRLKKKKKGDQGHDGGGEDAVGERNSLNQYHESTGI